MSFINKEIKLFLKQSLTIRVVYSSQVAFFTVKHSSISIRINKTVNYDVNLFIMSLETVSS